MAAARLAHDDAGARVLSELLEQRDTSPTTRAAALTALAELERPPDLAELREHACAQDAAVRAAAARCLGHLPGPAVVATLRRLLDDPSPEVQAAALEALGACAPLSMAPDLAAVALATRRDGRVRRAAREAMARLQARTGAAPGQLALLPEPAQGALSFPEALADAVALATADRALPRTPAPADAREYAAAQRGTAVSAADAPHSSSRTIAPEASFAPLTSSPASAADAPLATSSAITPEASAAPLDQR